MATHTSRDAVWTATLRKTHTQGDSVTAEEVAEFADVSLHTARDTLNTMEANGFLQRRVGDEGAVSYRPAAGGL